MLGKNTNERSAPVREGGNASAIPSRSMIGVGLTVTGDCVTDGHVQIHGTVAGDAVANGLELAPSGVIEGDVTVPKGASKGQVFVVAGRVAGRVTAHVVDVKKTGSVLGGIDAEQVTIHGTVEGNVRVRQRLVLASTGIVSGDVHTDRLVMEEGGRVNGTIRMGRVDEKPAAPKADPAAA